MIEQSLIPEKLKDFKYYKDKLPLYLKNSPTFQEHFRIWYDVLLGDKYKGIVGNGELLLNLINIFADDYEEFLASIDDSPTVQFDILDKIADLFGVNRNITVTYEDGQQVMHYNEEISLNDSELLVLIKSRIIQNYCEGTRKQIQEFYSSLGLTQGLSIRMLANGGLNQNEPATVDMYLIYEIEEGELSNIDKMFLAGMLNIESMGITYRYSQPLVPTSILKWAAEDGTGGENDWDEGRWII